MSLGALTDKSIMGGIHYVVAIYVYSVCVSRVIAPCLAVCLTDLTKTRSSRVQVMGKAVGYVPHECTGIRSMC